MVQQYWPNGMHPKKELIQHETLTAAAVSKFLSCCGSFFFFSISVRMNKKVKRHC